MADALHRRRWLTLRPRQRRVDAGPGWRAGRPDGRRGAGELRVIECSDPNEDQVGSGLGLAEQRGAAFAAETTVHSIAAVCDARKVTCLSRHLERRRAKARANRSAACAQVLAIPAPTHARDDGGLRAFPANRAAEAPASHCHHSLQGQGKVPAHRSYRPRQRHPSPSTDPSVHAPDYRALFTHIANDVAVPTPGGEKIDRIVGFFGPLARNSE